MPKPRLLVLTTTYPRWPGDTEPPFVHKLCVQLSAHFEVRVLAPHTQGASTDEALDGVQVQRYRYWFECWQALAYRGGLVANLKDNKWRLLQLPCLLLAQAFAIRRAVTNGEVDVIHAHWVVPQGLAARLALLGLRHQPRLVCTSHGGDLLGFDGSAMRVLKRWVLKRAAVLTTVSQLIAAKAQAIGIGPLKLEVIPMGIETAQMRDGATVDRAAMELLFVGRMVEKKGLPFLLEAMARLHTSLPRATLTLVGDGPMRPQLEAQSQVLGLQTCVRFIGALPNTQLPAHYRRATVCVAPSVVTAEGDQEGLPVTLMEAMACGCPVVASRLGGIAEVIEHEASGLLVAPADASALASALERMLQDPSLRERLATSAAAQVYGRFDWSGIARRHCEVLMPFRRPGNAQDVCAVIVAFHPDAGFSARLRTIAGQVGAIVVVDNTPAAARRNSIDLPPTLTDRALLLENPDNLGIATALNQGLAQARVWGFRWLLTLDQDTLVQEDLVDILLEVAGACGEEVAVIGANHLDERNGRTEVDAQGPGTWNERKTVITSGSLLRMSAAQVIGGFREDYFIDQVDHEYCLRVRSQGGRVVITRKVAMRHSVGEEGGIRLPWLGVLPSHSALRKYYIARNSITTVASQWRHEPGWCVRRMLRLFSGAVLMLLLESRRSLKLKSFVLGVSDGLRGRMGPCPHDALNKQ
jgi:glycosyltransferase involved in cell wall biosynthesis/GT2 family glycosyltransferase